MATRTISTKLAVEGESEYKKAVASCNSELSTMKSSLALVESAFKGNANSMEALSAKGSALSSVYDKQKEKVSTLENALKNAEAAQAQYSERVSAAKDNVERCEKALDGLKNSTGDTSEEQKALTEELNKWNAELSEAEGYEAAAERGVQNWQKQLNYANVDLNDLTSEIEKNNQYLEEAAESADGCASSIDKYGREVKGAGEDSDEFGDKSKKAIENLSQALAAAGVAATVKEIAAALMECVKASAEFEAAIAQVATIADVSKMSLEDISSAIITLSGKMAQSSSSLAEATYSAISAGVDTASAVEFTEKATKLAVGGFTEAQTAVDVLTTALNAYGLRVAETERVSDILVTTQNLGKTTVDELAKSVGKVIPLAAAYGVEMDNLGAAYAVLTANGVATAEAGTYLKAMLSELGKSSSTVATVLKEETGKSFAGLMASGASLGDVLDVLGNSVDGDATKFNELWSSTEAGVGALSIFNKGAENFNGVLGSMQTSAGATTAAFDTMANTTQFTQQRMNTSFDNLKIAMGTQLQPALNDIYNAGTEAFTWATDFVNENPWIVSAIMGVVAAIGVLAAGLAALKIIQTIIPLIKALNMALMQNPAILVAAAIAGLVVAIGTIVAASDTATASTKKLKEGLEESKTAYEELSATLADENTNTKNLVASLELLLAVEEKSEAQKATILEKVNELNEAIPELGLSYDETKDKINMTAESLENMAEAAAAQSESEAAVDRLNVLYSEQAGIAAELQAAQEALTAANEASTAALDNYSYSMYGYDYAAMEAANSVYEAQRRVDDLTAAQATNAEEIAQLDAATSAYIERTQANAVASAEMTATVNDLTAEIAALEASYEEAQKKAYDSISQQIGLFKEMDGSAKTSIDNLIATLTNQCEYMETYAENIQKAMELGVDQGLVQKLSDGSEESAQILASIVEGGSEQIDALNEQFSKVEEGKQAFSQTVAEMETDFNNKMTALVTDLNSAIQTMNVATGAYTIGADNIQGLINGTASKRQELIATYTEMANAALAAYRRVMAQASPSKKMAEAGRFDVQGLIIGAESEKAHLVDTYEGLAKEALNTMEKSLPSSIEEPSAAAAQRAQTDAIVSALKDKPKGGGDTYVSITSPEALDERAAAREFKKAQRDLSLGLT